MSPFFADMRARVMTPQAQKFIRYSLVSVVAVVTTVGVQTACLSLFKTDGKWSAIIASTIAAVPSYSLNRSWVWGKSGRSHLAKEVAPFWIMAFIGLAFSTWASDFADSQTHIHHVTSAWRTFVIVGASFTTFAVLWVAKFIIFNKILFAHREDQLDPALDGRSGLPT